MVKFNSVAAAFVLSAGWAATASAADLGPSDGGSFKDLPPVAEVYRWTGFVLGAGIGGGVVQYSGGVDGVFDVTPPGDVDTISGSIDDDQAFLFGTVQVGYDFQFVPRWVVGVFADFDFNDGAKTRFNDTTLLSTGAPGDALFVSGSADIDNSWNVGGRLGFLVNPTLLFYGLAAWNHTDIDIKGSFSTNVDGGTPVSFRDSDTLDGLTVGAGFETMVVRGLTLKFEYRFTDLDSIGPSGSLADLADGTSDGDGRAHADTDLHTARVVLSWRPGM